MTKNVRKQPKKCVSRKQKRIIKIAINKISKTQYGCTEIQ